MTTHPRPTPLALLIASLFLPPVVLAQVIANPQAPGAQRPVILNTANGLPQVDITAPTAAGVSMNRYLQFDIDARGAILNNGRTASHTALAGWVAANPALIAQPARVIVNQIDGPLPTRLNGYLEIAGNKADLIIANPAGITCNGCGFLHANRVELATGSPLWNGQQVTGYALSAAPLQVVGKGLDARSVEVLALHTKAAQVNAGLWAQQLELSLQPPSPGTPAAGTPAAGTPATDTPPAVVLDVAELGGMYANRIFLVGNAHGLGVRNAGTMSAFDQLVVTVDGRLENSGVIDAARVQLKAGTIDNVARGRVFGDTVAIEADRVANAGHPDAAPVIAAATRLDIGARNLENTDHALLFSGGDMAIGGALDAQGQASGQAEHVLNRAATIEALGSLSLSAKRLDNLNNGVVIKEVQTGDTTQQQYLQPWGMTEKVPLKQFRWERWSRAGQYRWKTDASTLTDGVPGKTPLPDVDGVDCDDNGADCQPTPGSAYPASHPAWAYFQLTPPDAPPPAPGTPPMPPTLSLPEPPTSADPDGSLMRAYQQQQSAYDTAWATYHEQKARHDSAAHAWQQWESATDERRNALDAAIATYNEGFNHIKIRRYTTYQVQRTEYDSQVVSSDPGRLIAGGDLSLAGEQLTNDQSQILAGGKLTGTLQNLENIDALGTHRVHESGTSQTSKSRYRGDLKGYHTRDNGPKLAYNPADEVSTIVLPVTMAKDGSAPPPPALTVATARLTAEGNSLYAVNPGSGPLLATDPRFTQYRSWLNSDVMLEQLRLDPSLLAKRLGDGYLEQRLVREQVAQLTGRRWLPGQTDDEAQFAQLMSNGVASAQPLQLRPGIALSAAQVAQLTTDLVWLVEQDVTLPDGRVERALVPQVYLRPRAGDLTGDGTLIAADSVALIVKDSLENAGLLAANHHLDLQAGRLANSGTLAGETVSAVADTDLLQHGGAIEARGDVTLAAGRNLTLQSSTQSATRESSMSTGTGSASRTHIDRIARVHVNGSGQLLIAAGNNVVLDAALVTHRGPGATTIVAGQDLTLGTVATHNAVGGTGVDARNYLRERRADDVGARIDTQGDVVLSAGRDLAATAANVRSESGAVTLSAERDLQLGSGESTREFAQGSYFKHRGAVGSTTSTSRIASSRTEVAGTTVSGARVAINAGRDVSVAGSNVVSDTGTRLEAQRNVQIAVAEASSTDSQYQKSTRTGLMTSGGAGLTLGHRSLKTDTQTTTTTAVGSTVGSTQGDVTIRAGEQVAQVGSQVIAPQGDIEMAGRTVAITEGRHTETMVNDVRFKQSGITAAISSPVITAVQTAQQMREAASNTNDPRMKALAAANTALAAANATEAVQAGQGTTINGQANQIATGKDASGQPTSRDATALDKVGGVQLSISVGNSRSGSHTVLQKSTAVASEVLAGGDVTIAARGDKVHSDLTIKGSEVVAGGSVNLTADHALTLQAAANTQTLRSNNSSSSASVGLVMSSNPNQGVGVNVAGSQGKGRANGDDLSWTNAKVIAGDQATLQSGGDTTIQGGVVAAPRVSVETGGQLTIESLQDKSDYTSRQQQVGGSATFGPTTTGNVNVAQSTVDSVYASVKEQSGIRAGDGGFDVKAAGDVTLTGGAITSTQAAVDAHRNQFTPEGELTTTDITNHARYSAHSVAVNLGTGFSPQGALVPGGTAVGLGNDGDSASSVTRAGISGVAGDKAMRTGDAESGIAKIFDAGTVQKAIAAQTQITQTFSALAPAAVAKYADEQMRELQRQQRETTDPKRRAELQQQIDQWADGGRYRVALHAAVGAAVGGVQGAAGAGTSAALVPTFAEAIDKTDLPKAAKAALIASAGTLLGAAVGGKSGAGAALSETTNNFLSHPEARQREAARQQLRQCRDDDCRQQAQQEIRRLDALDQWRDQQVADACRTPSSALCAGWYAALADAKQSYSNYAAREDATQSVADERRQVSKQEFLYRQRRNNPFAFGVARGLMKLTPPALVVGVGFTAYEVTTAVMEVGAAEAAIAIARGLADLPATLRARLNSEDPTVRGEALVDALSIAGASTAIVGRLQQQGSNAITLALEKQAALKAEVRATAKAGLENNVYRDSSLADPGKPVYSATGPWVPAAQLKAGQANALIERSLPAGGQIIGRESADRLNVDVLKDNPHFAPPYVPGTEAILVETKTNTKFVRYYVEVPDNSEKVGKWMMRAEDVAYLTPEQIASKFSLPQVPTHVAEVVVPAGYQMRVTMANDINIYSDRSLGGNGGGGGVQFELLTQPLEKNQWEKWFSNERKLK